MIDPAEVRELVAALVHVNSINPSLVPGAPGERELARVVAGSLEAAGLEVRVVGQAEGRPSVVGILRGSEPGPQLMLNAHLDTVGVEGMGDPFGARVEGGRLYGRGAYDMKGSLAACLLAARTLRQRGWRRGELLVAAAADEEDASLGTRMVLEEFQCDAAIVTEPTQLQVCIAHKGFSWIEITVTGRAAHGSRYDLGIDANLGAGRVLARLALLEQRLAAVPPHPLVGRPSLHVPLLRGGSGISTYAATSTITVERRTVPGEPPGQALREIEALLDEVRRDDPAFEVTARELLEREPFEAAAGGGLVTMVREAAGAVLGAEPALVGESFWMDAALCARAGVETVVIGPRGGGAHAEVEWVDLESVRQLAEILVRTAERYCGG